ncbi:EamA family transporter [Paenibacillus thalictri]|uniref:EamA/RhaT family transporter n=1 Tax=Paenibacillus thalictri TaxID=2527873 RepID=A0A4Q9DLA1_9BACL|nr:DMT family transporter [Paenibacillus thalictri]TBL75716.1 EamA/RhaT family transporter [Paenibacillus thalictri]
MNAKKRLQASLLVLIGAASYGMLSTFVKLAYAQGFTASEVTASQVFFGAVVMWLICLPFWKQIRRIPFRIALKLMGSGFFTGICGVFYYYSLQTLDASFAVLLLFQFTWMGLLVDMLLGGKMPGKFQLLSVLIVLAGTLLASGVLQGGISRISPSGIGLGLLAAASYTMFIFFSGKVATEVPAVIRSAWMLTGALAIVLAMNTPQFLWNGSLPGGLWFWAILLSLFGMIIPPYMFAKGAPYLDTGVSALIGAVELPVVILCSNLLLGEHTGIVKWLGVALIFCGVGISGLKSKSKPEPAS